jgi:hypothetical protein
MADHRCITREKCLHCAWATGNYKAFPSSFKRKNEIVIYEDDAYKLTQARTFRYQFYLLSKCHTGDVNIMLRAMLRSMQLIYLDTGIRNLDGLVNCGFTKACKLLGKEHSHAWIEAVDDEGHHLYDERYGTVDGIHKVIDKPRHTPIESDGLDNLIPPRGVVLDDESLADYYDLLMSGVENFFREKIATPFNKYKDEFYSFFYFRDGKLSSIKMSYPSSYTVDERRHCKRACCDNNECKGILQYYVYGDFGQYDMTGESPFGIEQQRLKDKDREERFGKLSDFKYKWSKEENLRPDPFITSNLYSQSSLSSISNPPMLDSFGSGYKSRPDEYWGDEKWDGSQYSYYENNPSKTGRSSRVTTQEDKWTRQTRSYDSSRSSSSSSSSRPHDSRSFSSSRPHDSRSFSSSRPHDSSSYRSSSQHRGKFDNTGGKSDQLDWGRKK